MSKQKKRIKNLDLFFPAKLGEHCVNARGLHKRLGSKVDFTAWWGAALRNVPLTAGTDFVVITPKATVKVCYGATYKLTPKAAIAILKREESANGRDVANLLDACRGRWVLNELRYWRRASPTVAESMGPKSQALKALDRRVFGARCGNLLVGGFHHPEDGEATLTVRDGRWPVSLLDGDPIDPTEPVSTIAGALRFALAPMVSTSSHNDKEWAAGGTNDLATLLPEYDFHAKKAPVKKAACVATAPEEKAEVEPIGSAPSETSRLFVPTMTGGHCVSAYGLFEHLDLGHDRFTEWWKEQVEMDLRMHLDYENLILTPKAALVVVERDHIVTGDEHVFLRRMIRGRQVIDWARDYVGPMALHKEGSTWRPYRRILKAETPLGTPALVGGRWGSMLIAGFLDPSNGKEVLVHMEATGTRLIGTTTIRAGQPPVIRHKALLTAFQPMVDQLSSATTDDLQSYPEYDAYEVGAITDERDGRTICWIVRPEDQDSTPEEDGNESAPADSAPLDYSVREGEDHEAMAARAMEIARAWLRFGSGPDARNRRAQEWGKCHDTNPALAALAQDALNSLRAACDQLDQNVDKVYDQVREASRSALKDVEVLGPDGALSDELGFKYRVDKAKVRVIGVDMVAGESISVPAWKEDVRKLIAEKRAEQLAEVERGSRQWAKLIEEKDGKSLVNARLLHAELGVGKDFSNWIKDQLVAHKCVEGQHFGVFAEIGENPKGGRPAKEYHLDPEAAKHIALSSKTEVAKDMRAYLIACEEELRQGQRLQPAIQRLRQGLPGAQLTHISTFEDYKAAVPAVIGALRGLIEFLPELVKRGDERQRREALDKEQQPLLPGIEAEELKAAKNHISGLNETMKALEKERDQLRQQVAELERQGAVVGLAPSIKQTCERNDLARELEDTKAERDSLKDELKGAKELIETQDDRLEDRLAFIRTLQASADTRDKELQRLSDRNKELEKQMLRPASTLASDAAAREALEEELGIVKAKADKLTDLIIERDRLFDQAQEELAEARRETRRWAALVKGPDEDVTLTDFFKETESVLGFSPTDGTAFLTREEVGVLYRKEDAVGHPYLWPNHKYRSYFHQVAYKYNHPIEVDGKRTDKFLSVKTYTTKLIPDEKDADGNVLRIGGYSWLKKVLMEHDLTTLHRLLAETGGPDGEFGCFEGYVLSKSKGGDDSLPGLLDVGERVIMIAKGTGDQVPKGEWVAGCRKDDWAEQAMGLTLRDALRNLRDKLVG